MNNLEKHFNENGYGDYEEFYGYLDRFPGYAIGRDGSIWSNKRNKEWNKLKTGIDYQGYPFLTLTDNINTQRRCKIHKLLALCFIPNPDNKPFACHKDDDKNNISLDNLYWGTMIENMNDAIKNNRGGFLTSRQIYNHDYTKLWQLLQTKFPGLSLTEIAKQITLDSEFCKEILSTI